jgi:hypothetical protein
MERFSTVGGRTVKIPVLQVELLKQWCVVGRRSAAEVEVYVSKCFELVNVYCELKLWMALCRKPVPYVADFYLGVSSRF